MSTKNYENNIVIRKAVSKDMVEVFQMIKELLEFLRKSDTIQIDEITLERDFTQNSPSFQCIVAETPNSQLVGYAIFCLIYSTCDGWAVHLEDLYVRPETRGQGVGRKLFLAAMKSAYDFGCKRAIFQVLSWNPAVKFYKELGAVDVTEKDQIQAFRMEQDSLAKLFN